MGIGETPALADQPIKMRCGDFVLRVVGLDVTHAKIVGQNEHNVGLGGLSRSADQSEGRQDEFQKSS